MKVLVRAGLVVIVAGLVVGSVVGALLYSVTRRGLSTRVEPSQAEVLLTRAARRLATPAAVRNVHNPVQPTKEVLADARAHFADHCASCHGNDGSGNTSLGRSFYPKVPDMRKPGTQSLTDGELFSIIEHGIRLTGMPAWGDGTPAGEQSSWALVHFVRRLSTLTPEDLEQMGALNPKSPEEFRQDEEARRFLAGEDTPAVSGPAPLATPSGGHKH